MCIKNGISSWYIYIYIQLLLLLLLITLTITIIITNIIIVVIIIYIHHQNHPIQCCRTHIPLHIPPGISYFNPMKAAFFMVKLPCHHIESPFFITIKIMGKFIEIHEIHPMTSHDRFLR